MARHSELSGVSGQLIVNLCDAEKLLRVHFRSELSERGIYYEEGLLFRRVHPPFFMAPLVSTFLGQRYVAPFMI